MRVLQTIPMVPIEEEHRDGPGQKRKDLLFLVCGSPFLEANAAPVVVISPFRVRNGVKPTKENCLKWLAASCRLCNRFKRTQYTGLKACIERAFTVTGKPIPFSLRVNDAAELGDDSGWCMGCTPLV